MWLLWAYSCGELAITVVLWRMNDGGWYNYAIEAVVIVCILTGRDAARAFDDVASRRSFLAAALAALAVPVFAFTDVKGNLDRAPGRTRWISSGSQSSCRAGPPRSSSSIFRVRTVSTAGSTWFMIRGFTPFLSRSAWPSHDQSGSSAGPLDRPGPRRRVDLGPSQNRGTGATAHRAWL